MPRARVLFAVAVVTLLAAPTLALAHTGDRRPHVQSFQEIRDIRADAYPNGDVTFDLTRPTEPLRDTIRFEFTAKAGEMRYTYRPDGADEDGAFTFSVILDEIVEYRDDNANARYDETADSVARRYPVKTMRWSANETAPLFVGKGLAEKKEAPHVVSNGSFGIGGQIRLQFYASGHQLDTGAARMHPQDVKSIWNVAQFPFVRDDTRFAIVARLVTPMDAPVLIERNADGETTGVVFRTANRLGFFDWADYALANNTGEPVERRTVLAHVADARASEPRPGFEERRITISYPRADFLLSHDPTVGLEYAPREPPALLGFQPAWILGAVLLAALGGSGYWYARKGGRDRVRERVREWVDAARK